MQVSWDNVRLDGLADSVTMRDGQLAICTNILKKAEKVENFKNLMGTRGTL